MGEGLFHFPFAFSAYLLHKAVIPIHIVGLRSTVPLDSGLLTRRAATLLLFVRFAGVKFLPGHYII